MVKGHWPKPPIKQRRPSARSVAAAALKRALEARFGSQGAASAVRRIDPATGAVIEIIPAARQSALAPRYRSFKRFQKQRHVTAG